MRMFVVDTTTSESDMWIEINEPITLYMYRWRWQNMQLWERGNRARIYNRTPIHIRVLSLLNENSDEYNV